MDSDVETMMETGPVSKAEIFDKDYITCRTNLTIKIAFTIMLQGLSTGYKLGW